MEPGCRNADDSGTAKRPLFRFHFITAPAQTTPLHGRCLGRRASLIVYPGRWRGRGAASSIASLLGARMILEQPDDVMDVDRPDGERFRVKLRGEAARRPEVAAGVTRLLREAVDGNVYASVTAYANGVGLAATYFLGTESVIIEIYEPLTLTPLVNASGGSPRLSASRHPNGPAIGPLARLLRPRARPS
jgi:hypothetical protein